MGVRTYGGVDKYLRCLKRGEDEFSSGRGRCESIGSGLGMRRQMRRMNRVQAKTAEAAAPAETTHAGRMTLQLPDIAR